MGPTQNKDFKKSNTQFIRQLGKGSHGMAKLVKVKTIHHKLFVMKEIGIYNKQQIKMSINEVKYLKKMRHKNVIKYYGSDAI